jgi:hypothetical protein
MNGRKPVKPRAKMNITQANPDCDAPLGQDVQDAIGRQLRAMYDTLVSQAVPARLTDLLKKLDQPDDPGRH